MSIEDKRLAFQKSPKNIKAIGIVITSTLTIAATLLASFLFYWLTNKSPYLQYEILSVTNFHGNYDWIDIVHHISSAQAYKIPTKIAAIKT
jgi:hypothetical protein